MSQMTDKERITDKNQIKKELYAEGVSATRYIFDASKMPGNAIKIELTGLNKYVGKNQALFIIVGTEGKKLNFGTCPDMSTTNFYLKLTDTDREFLSGVIDKETVVMHKYDGLFAYGDISLPKLYENSNFDILIIKLSNLNAKGNIVIGQNRCASSKDYVNEANKQLEYQQIMGGQTEVKDVSVDPMPIDTTMPVDEPIKVPPPPVKTSSSPPAKMKSYDTTCMISKLTNTEAGMIDQPQLKDIINSCMSNDQQIENFNGTVAEYEFFNGTVAGYDYGTVLLVVVILFVLYMICRRQ
jgi:hypothetical protein